MLVGELLHFYHAARPLARRSHESHSHCVREQRAEKLHLLSYDVTKELNGFRFEQVATRKASCNMRAISSETRACSCIRDERPIYKRDTLWLALVTMPGVQHHAIAFLARR